MKAARKVPSLRKRSGLFGNDSLLLFRINLAVADILLLTSLLFEQRIHNTWLLVGNEYSEKEYNATEKTKLRQKIKDIGCKATLTSF